MKRWKSSNSSRSLSTHICDVQMFCFILSESCPLMNKHWTSRLFMLRQANIQRSQSNSHSILNSFSISLEFSKNYFSVKWIVDNSSWKVYKILLNQAQSLVIVGTEFSPGDDEPCLFCGRFSGIPLLAELFLNQCRIWLDYFCPNFRQSFSSFYTVEHRQLEVIAGCGKFCDRSFLLLIFKQSLPYL